MNRVDTSIVIPVYNSRDCLNDLAARLTDVLTGMARAFEIILINDYSNDDSWEVIKQLCMKIQEVKGVNLRKNFGQDNAIMAGLHHASGNIIVIMDDDLQHSPSDIPSLVDSVESGYDICYGRYDDKKQTWVKNLGSWFNDKVANWILNKPKDCYLSPFKAIRSEIIREVMKYDGPYPYIDGLLFRVTRNVTQVDIEHYKRHAGRGNYNLWKSISVWLKLTTSFSVLPLRISTFLGFLSSGLGFILALFFIGLHLSGIKSPTGWPSLIVTIIFIGGIQLIGIGIIGEYIGRTFIHHNKDPQFVISEIVGKGIETNKSDL